MNNKGFMMAEVVVVSSIILVALVGLYTSYNKIFSIYNQRVNYYDVATLYELASIRDNNFGSLTLNSTNNVNGKLIYYVSLDSVKNKTISKTNLNETFKDYLDYLSTSLDFDNMKINEFEVNNILVMEKCDSDGKSNCKYAYLEVLENETS